MKGIILNNTQTVVIRGKASFAKILGDPVLNYTKDGKEWKLDLEISKDTEKELKGYGIGDKVKKKDGYLDGAPHLTFKQPEFQKSGKANEPIKVSDILGEAWDQKKLIGNKSDIEVRFVIVDYGPGKKRGVYIRSVRVLRLEEYNRSEFTPIAEDDEFFALAQAAEERRAEVLAQYIAEAALDVELASPPFEVDDLDDELPL